MEGAVGCVVWRSDMGEYFVRSWEPNVLLKNIFRRCFHEYFLLTFEGEFDEGFRILVK